MGIIKQFFRTRFINPILEFIQDSRAVGITLFACTIISLLWSNSRWADAYTGFWNLEIHLPEFLKLPHSLLHWINDLLMAIFFFLVGMEIKRELLNGELSSLKQSVVPVAAAIGGMVVPAGIFLALNKGTDFQHGWGIPMATDIAFSLGVASLLGKRVPFALKVFLMALAIIDDLGAILVIALFYGGDVQTQFLWIAAGICGVLFLLSKTKLKFGPLHFLIGLLLWYVVFRSGIHATIAGVVFAMFVPLKQLPDLEHKFHDPVNFLILPIFALANTAITIPGDFAGAIGTSLSWGIILGLVLGKPIGITLMSWLMVVFKIGEKPKNTSWIQLMGVGVLAGIGFTMSIFIATLAFDSKENQDISKIATLIASMAAMVIGLIWLYLSGKKNDSAEEVNNNLNESTH
jgi:NhaA family Na+:H+ antiporter